MHEVWRALGISQHRVEHLSIMRQEVAMIRARGVPVKHGMTSLMLELKRREIKVEAIPGHMNQYHTETQQLKEKNETTKLIVHTGHINKSTKLPLPTE